MISQKVRTIVLIGQPNSGKSTLFRVLSDIKSADTGSTVDIKSTAINIHGLEFNLIDLPGIYSLNYTQPAEEMTSKFLMNQNIDLVINVIDASMLTRSLELTVELLELGIPVVAALNLQDEAERRGISINKEMLETLLGIPVISIHATHGKGAKELVDSCYRTINKPNKNQKPIEYTHHLEVHIEALAKSIAAHTKGMNGSPRYYAVKALENPSMLPEGIVNAVHIQREEIERDMYEHHKKDMFETVSYERHHISMSISEKISITNKSRKMPLVEKFDSFLLHPIFGYFFLIIFFFLYFFSIFVIGNFLSGLTSPPLEWLGTLFEPLKADQPFLWNTINGAYMGVVGILGIVLPYFLPLVLLTSLYEESGYLARVAFLVDGLMHRIGLHGKSVAPFILGFGCSIPAIYATRMIENRRDRIVTAALIPFVPCSARIAVIFALTAAYTGPIWAFIIFAYVLLMIAIHGKVLSKFLSKPVGLIMDIPRLKAPSAKSSIKKTWIKIVDFIKEAIVFLVLGSIALGWVEYFNAAHYLNILFAPVLDFVLGLPEALGSTLFFGFFRKELILVMASQSLGVSSISHLPLTPEQIVVFIVFVTFYFPCFTTFVVIWKEFGWKVVLLSSVISMVVAAVSGFIFKVILANLHFFV